MGLTMTLRTYGPQLRRHTFFTASHTVAEPKPPLPPIRLIPKDETRAKHIVPPPQRPPTAFRWQRAAMLPVAVLTLMLGLACRNANPAAPTSTQPAQNPAQEVRHTLDEVVPDLHGTPASLEADVLKLQPGSIVYICTTQLRQYVVPGGDSTWERDVYISAAHCPERPID